LGARLAKFDAHALAWCKDIGHITNILWRFDVVDGHASMPLHEFHVPDSTVLGGQGSDIGRLSPTLREQNGVMQDDRKNGIMKSRDGRSLRLLDVTSLLYRRRGRGFQQRRRYDRGVQGAK